MPPQRLHHAKFRWTENLTCRFIQLRKENGKLFTGRKYSAQAGWELILRQMREEFPTIMAHVHYRVLKKKWSNLLQQYKELRNPVHGDRNKADDVSWPFFGAIDQVLEDSNRQTAALLSDDYIDPQEFLCVSVTPEVPGLSSEGRPAGSDAELRSKDSTILTLRRLQSPDNNDDDDDDDDCSIEIDEHGAPSRTGRLASGLVPPGKRSTHRDPVPRIPRATGLSIERIPLVSGEKRTEDDLRHRRFQRDANSAEGTGSGQSLRRRETIVDPPRSPPIAPTWTPGDGGGGGEPAGLENRRVHQVVGGQLAETSNCQSRRTISEARQVSGGNWPLRETLNEAKQSGAGDGRALESGADGEDAKWQRGKPRKPGRVRATRGSCPGGEEDDRELRIYQRLEQLLEYARRRDEENRSIMMRILQAVEAIAKKL